MGNGEIRNEDRTVAREGFTLLELLVVIAIIALLLSIFTPSVGILVRLTEQTWCATNLNKFATATTGFFFENEGRIPSCMEWIRETKLEYGEAGWSWNLACPRPYRSDEFVRANNHARDPVQNGKFWPYIGARKAYVCPTFADLPYPGKGQAGYGLQFTYAMNGHMDHLWHRNDDRKRWYQRLADIRNPSKVYLMADEMPYPTPGHSIAGLNDGVLFTDGYPGRDALGCMHGDGTVLNGYANAVFVDAHVRTVHMWESKEVTFDPP